jgi:hypothetical protein
MTNWVFQSSSKVERGASLDRCERKLSESHAITEDPDVIEDGRAGFGASDEAVAINQLLFCERTLWKFGDELLFGRTAESLEISWAARFIVWVAFSREICAK